MAIDIPKGIKKAPTDYIEYSTYVDGHLKHTGSNRKACYSGIMYSLTTVGFHCCPVATSSGLPPEHYLKWMRLCQEYQLVPKSTQPYVDKGGNYLIIPGGVYDRHWVYAALCCYRWSSAYANMVWQIVEHVEKLEGITFWQALHYGLATHCKGVNHNFLSINNVSGPYGGRKTSHDLAYSLAIPVFFSQSVEERKRLNNSYTITAIAAIAKQLGGQENGKATLYIEAFEDLLTPKWTALYREEKPTKETLLALYNEAA